MDKNIIFLEKARAKHNNFYDYSKTIYVNKRTKITITCPVHGDFIQQAGSHSSGNGCRQCAKEKRANNLRWTTEKFVKESKKVQTTSYDYSKVVYKTNKTKVIIICPNHGEFEQLPYMHLRGHGCDSCARIETGKMNLKSTNEFITEANIVHSEKYIYTKTRYKGALAKVAVTCTTHGEFTQRPSDHLAGHGCPTCAESLGWSHTAWATAGGTSNFFTGYKLYVIRCWNDYEEFIKIGKTFTSISKRFASTAMPYEWELIQVKEGSAKYISNMEHQIHKELYAYKYAPKNEFGGQTECFTKEALVNISLTN